MTLLILISLWFVHRHGPYKLTYNATESVEVGWYVLYPKKGPLKRGDLVFVRAPERARTLGCVGRRQHLLKHIVGMPKDVICLHRGRLLTPTDAPYSIGPTTLPYHFDGCITLDDASVFLATHHPHSCDSRLFGPYPLKHVQMRASKL